MIPTSLRYAFAFAAAFATFAQSSLASAGDLSKDECVDAHSRGQDAREAGKLSLARKLFLTCAQPACPALVQGDCARFADDLTRLQPTVAFAARDGNGSDLPDTTIYVDDILVLTRLDGKPHDVDPGTHTVKFTNGGREQITTVVIGSGEKGRTVVGTFAAANLGSSSSSTAATKEAPPTVRPPNTTTHPGGSKAVIALGAVAAGGGVALAIWGIAKVPSNCSISTHECAAPPGDKSFDDAASGVRLTNIGFAVTGIGVAAIAGGLYWYFSGSKTTKEEHLVATPWFTPEGAGFAVSGRL
jgi:hypothetical protein